MKNKVRYLKNGKFDTLDRFTEKDEWAEILKFQAKEFQQEKETIFQKKLSNQRKYREAISKQISANKAQSLLASKTNNQANTNYKLSENTKDAAFESREREARVKKNTASLAVRD